ncbi:MAG TPA: hydrogenase maturation protease [bacterium]|nr:hydrogenase maturation protease [bacterium]
MRPRLVIGIGNTMRRDDGAGLAVAEAVRAARPEIEVLTTGGDGAALLDAWAGARRVVVIDAARSGRPPGSIQRFDAAASALPRVMSSASTHVFGLADAVELARALGALPAGLIVYAVEGADFTAGEGLSPQLMAAVPGVADLVCAELDRDDA